MNNAPRLSVIIEWSNALLTEADRPARMMEALAAQAAQLDPGRDGGQENGRFPLEVLVCFDGSVVDSETISRMAPLASPGLKGSLHVRKCNFPGAEYYDLKKRGAEQASGELFLFLDSDVVPQEGWLENLWHTFCDQAFAVVAGVSFIDPVNLYASATALNWVFGLSPDWREIRPATHFWANNVCFRRDVFEANPFPTMNGSSRGACQALANSLVAKGIPLHVNGAARVTHPAPSGLGGFLERAMAQGRDRVLWHRNAGSWWMQSAPAGLLRYFKNLAKVVWRSTTRFRAVGLRLWDVPAVLVISGVYYTVFLVGELLTHVAPGYMKRSFRV